MLKIVQGCRDLWLDSQVTHDYQSVKAGTHVKHVGGAEGSRQWERYRTKLRVWPGS